MLPEAAGDLRSMFLVNSAGFMGQNPDAMSCAAAPLRPNQLGRGVNFAIRTKLNADIAMNH